VLEHDAMLHPMHPPSSPGQSPSIQPMFALHVDPIIIRESYATFWIVKNNFLWVKNKIQTIFRWNWTFHQANGFSILAI
jgi:hypothetical protein